MTRESAPLDRREQILLATCEEISANGFRLLRIADVARRAGTSTGTVHYHFDTKAELMQSAFEWNFGRSVARRRQLLDGADPALAKLRRFIDSYLPDDPETVAAWRIWAELWVEALHNPALQQVNDTVYGEWRRMVAAIIRDGQAAGDIRNGDAVVMANALIAMIDGLSLQVIVNSLSMTIDRMRDVCVAYLDTLATA